jgi:putative methyltransferase (TIGR04325 family)
LRLDPPAASLCDMSVRDRLVVVLRNVTPPFLFSLLREARDGLRRRRRAELIIWEHVPEGWDRERHDPEVKGWDVEAVGRAYAAKWPSFRRALEGSGPLGIYHEVPLGHDVVRDDYDSHNTVMSFAYVLALTAQTKDAISLLDWGGGLGHYSLIAQALLPDVEIEYHCKEVPAICVVGRELQPDVTFHDGDGWRGRTYDLVMASNSLQYSRDWKITLTALREATASYLYVTRLPVVLDAPTFLVVQRPYRQGYATEYLSWALNRDAFLEGAEGGGCELIREFLLGDRFLAKGAPEEARSRGFLFRPARPARSPG